MNAEKKSGEESGKRFSVRFSDEQEEELARQAEAYGLSINTLIKRRVLGITPSDMADLNQIANDVREYKASAIRTECRVNEIAHACCGINSFSESDCQDIKGLLNQLIDDYDELIRGISNGNHHGPQKDVSKDEQQLELHEKPTEQAQKKWSFDPAYLDDLRIT